MRGGIIPARAGFTVVPAGTPDTDADHPRSRGVYSVRTRCWATASGSSPLARGLPPGGRGGVGHGRIIPARAGFTREAAAPRRIGRDHPRSRGVYFSLLCVLSHIPGSSPLARGLRGRYEISPCYRRIIPARAGFTARRAGLGRGRRDHPRSRGVYRPLARTAARNRGSSPLARGLQVLGDAGPAAARIIPARAGFTHLGHRHRLARQDHPRSRGVYALWRGPAGPHPGSSPLARGLRGAGP